MTTHFKQIENNKQLNRNTNSPSEFSKSPSSSSSPSTLLHSLIFITLLSLVQTTLAVPLHLPMLPFTFSQSESPRSAEPLLARLYTTECSLLWWWW